MGLTLMPQSNRAEAYEHWDTSQFTDEERLQYEKVINAGARKSQDIQEDYHPFLDSIAQESIPIRHVQLLQLIDPSIQPGTKWNICTGIPSLSFLLVAGRHIATPSNFPCFGLPLCTCKVTPTHIKPGNTIGFKWGNTKLNCSHAVLLHGTYKGSEESESEIAVIKGIYRMDTALKAACWIRVDLQRLVDGEYDHECDEYESEGIRFFPLGGPQSDWRVLKRIHLLDHPTNNRKIWNTWIWREVSLSSRIPGANLDETGSECSEEHQIS